jgi:hypothetical protein
VRRSAKLEDRKVLPVRTRSAAPDDNGKRHDTVNEIGGRKQSLQTAKVTVAATNAQEQTVAATNAQEQFSSNDQRYATTSK